MANFIWAKKGNHLKKFHSDSWNLLKDKNGWIEVSSEDQVAKKIERAIPDAGTKEKLQSANQVVENLVKKEDGDATQVVTDETKVDSEKQVDETAIPDAGTKEDENAQPSSEFIKVAKENLTKALIKDYFDKADVNVSYSNSANLDALILQLADHFKNDVAALKTAFNIDQL